SKNCPEEHNIDGSNFVRVDHLQLVNDESEKAHKFRIEGQKDMWKSRQTFTYPDKETVSDSGIAYIGGEAKWQVQNLKPGKDLIVIKRLDATPGEQICDISVDGKKVGPRKVTEGERKPRWLNHDFQGIGGEKGRGSQDKSREVCGWMVALNGQHKGEDFRLRVGKNVLGTAADCDIVLTDKKISRKHATVRYEGGEFQIADLDSSNGTFVNDEKVQKHDLIDNDIIKLGDIEFEFKCRALREKRE